MERELTVLHQPEAGLVGVEERPRAIDDVVQHRAEVELPGELLRHVTQRP